MDPSPVSLVMPSAPPHVSFFRRWWPPPARWAAPLLVLIFGLAATGYNYWLSLEVDLAQRLETARARAGGVTQRLAALAEIMMANERPDLIRRSLVYQFDVYDLALAAVVDHRGQVIADSTGKLTNFPVQRTPLAGAAASLIRPVREAAVEQAEDSRVVYGACPFSMPGGGTGWALIALDRREAIETAVQGARVRFYMISAAMLVLSLALWAALHFGYARRLAALAASVRAAAEGEDTEKLPLPGGYDEVGRLSADYAALMHSLSRHEDEEARLQRDVLHISEMERQRIGHDLHDSLGQRLTAASMTANAMLSTVRESSPVLVPQAELVSQQLREAIVEARSLSHGLAPVSLDAGGLREALTEMARSIDAAGRVRCIAECPPGVRVDDPRSAVELFRIAQEAVNNALKHAEASEIRIALHQQGPQLVLEVEDDGTGFDEKPSWSSGMGLRVMRYRAKITGATLTIGPAPAGGTLARCVLPLLAPGRTGAPPS